MSPQGASPDSVINQDKVFKFQNKFSQIFEEKINRLSDIASHAVPNWNQLVSEKLFPIDVQINIGMPAICSNAQVVGDRPTMFIGSEGASKSLFTVVMHELGHLIFRTLGYSTNYNKSNYEEGMADFIALISNNFSPYIGENMGTQVKSQIDQAMNSDMPIIQKVGLKGTLDSMSERALRDFTKALNYPDMFIFPEEHLLAAHLGGLLYQLGLNLKQDLLVRAFLSLIVTNHAVFYSAD